jgi:nicotinate dehydrogenase subunit B
MRLPPLSRREVLGRGGVIAVVSPRKGAANHTAPSTTGRHAEDRPEAASRRTHNRPASFETPAARAPQDDAVGWNGHEEGLLDIHVCLTAESRVVAYCGHVDLGTGIRTALAQMVAEELDWPFDAVEMVLGDTEDTPDQGATIASETIQVTSLSLCAGAAQIRGRLLMLAAQALACSVAEIEIADGIVRRAGGEAIDLAMLLGNHRALLPLDPATPLKPTEAHRIVGKPVARVDIPAKATGTFTYVHDVRVPGMLHGRVVRPPYAGIDAGEFVGRSLIGVDRDSVAAVPGLRAIVVEGDFVGIVAEREEQAEEAARRLVVRWREFPPAADLGDLATALRRHPSTARRLVDEGDVEAALAAEDTTRLDRTYTWPYQMHGSIGPSCAVADVHADGVRIWAGSQNPHVLQGDIALLLGLPADRVAILRYEAAGCYGRNCADDVAADAALLSRAIGAPVRVQLTREQEHLWEPKGAAQLIDIRGGLGPDGALAAYDFETRYPSNAAPTLALLLTGRIAPNPATLKMGDRTAIPPYAYENLRITARDMPPIVRASWLRGVSAMPNVFAHESYIDELAHEAGEDPVAFRLRHITDERAAALTRATAERAGWEPHAGPRRREEGGLLHGRGFAQARYVHGNWPGVGAAWAAWAADVAVDPATGEVTVSRVVVGQDTGLMVNPAGVRHQIHGNVLQSTSRVLREEVTFSETSAVAARDWGGYPVLTFPELPSIDVMMLDRRDQPPLGAGESASVPSAAAIVNAVFDATGVRFRELPLTPERVLAGLGRAPSLPAPRKPRRSLFAPVARIIGAATAAATCAAIAVSLAPAIAPIARPDPATWSAATIERGRQLAGLGACAVCHTAPGGERNAGGLALETPFGIVVSTNITPDVETGIGAWSYPAFARAMREGIGRDGSHLYPAFPYTNFAKASDADLQALYAYLMAQPAVRRKTEPSRLVAPLNLRPLMAGWNLLFHRNDTPTPADPARSEAWNRGRELVDGLGHCGACHSPRNILGAERGGRAYLAGGEAEGWHAPALADGPTAPIPWSEASLFAYLRTGTAAHHGTASGPMAPIVEELRALPDADIRAMATYLVSLSTPLPAAEETARADAVLAATASTAHPPTSRAARMYDAACAACHETGRIAPLFNEGPALGLSAKLHGPSPANLVRMIIGGAAHGSGQMPAFGEALDDRQIADLAGYLRARFAPGKPEWEEMEEAIGAARKAAASTR